LNKIIDEELPGRPHFERYEILMEDEVCEIFMRDIIECLKALFGDPELGQYLVFVPEMHYTDETVSVRLYHDMHTGKWWWGTQVRLSHFDILHRSESPTSIFRRN